MKPPEQIKDIMRFMTFPSTFSFEVIEALMETGRMKKSSIPRGKNRENKVYERLEYKDLAEGTPLI